MSCSRSMTATPASAGESAFEQALGRYQRGEPTAEVLADPRHPYAWALAHAVPRLDTPVTARLPSIEGMPPDPLAMPRGCRFAPRCPLYEQQGRPAVCTDPASEPPLRDVGKGHVVACHFA